MSLSKPIDDFVRNKIFLLGDFYIYDITEPKNNTAIPLFLIGHSDCPEKTSRYCNEFHEELVCGGCNAIVPAKDAQTLKDALELINSTMGYKVEDD